ncbi:hypothetical protein CU044_2550 [Streptomyces sp. L-9-10]|nr:hypothetical protein CU044_2550 [Streptomyces sp. L-9-10]
MRVTNLNHQAVQAGTYVGFRPEFQDHAIGLRSHLRVQRLQLPDGDLVLHA